MDALTGIDFVVEGVCEDTSYKPLELKVTLEFNTGVRYAGHVSRLIAMIMDVEHAVMIKSMIQSFQNHHGRQLKIGLPGWGRWIPWYTPLKRRMIQTIIFTWTIFSIIWAMTQLYQHFTLFRHLIKHLYGKVYHHVAPIWEKFGLMDLWLSCKELLLVLVEPMQVLFVAISSPLYRLVGIFWKMLLSMYRVMVMPVQSILSFVQYGLSPVFAMVRSIWQVAYIFLKTILYPLQVIWRILYMPVQLLYTIVKEPLSKLFHVIKVPFRVAVDLTSKVLSKSSSMEIDVQHERIEKIRRIAQNNTKAVAMGLKRLKPDFLEAKNVVMETMIETSEDECTVESHFTIPHQGIKNKHI